MKKLLSLLLLSVALFGSYAYADTTGYNNGTALGRGEEINYGYGLQATKSGEKFTIGLFGAANGYVSQVSSVAALPLNYSTVGIPIQTLVGNVFTLANGTPGQIENFFTFALAGSSTAVITPATSTGFTTATLGHNGASVTMQYINSTIGWIIISYDNVAVS